MTSKLTLIVSLAAASVGGSLLAQPQAPPLTVEPVRGGVYLVKGGSGANTGFIVGKRGHRDRLQDDRGVDQGGAGRDPESHAESRATVILTHSDGDHVNGLSGLPQGLDHHRPRQHAEGHGGGLQGSEDERPAAVPAHRDDHRRPDRSISTACGWTCCYFGPAHTSGDLVVLLPQQKIAFVGDLLFVGRDPLDPPPEGRHARWAWSRPSEGCWRSTPTSSFPATTTR